MHIWHWLYLCLHHPSLGSTAAATTTDTGNLSLHYPRHPDVSFSQLCMLLKFLLCIKVCFFKNLWWQILWEKVMVDFSGEEACSLTGVLKPFVMMCGFLKTSGSELSNAFPSPSAFPPSFPWILPLLMSPSLSSSVLYSYSFAGAETFLSLLLNLSRIVLILTVLTYFLCIVIYTAL